MSWLILLLAGAFEVLWAVGLKLYSSNTRPSLIVLTGIAIALSMGLLALSMKNIPLGTAYAIWTGIGAIGAFTVGVIFFEEPLTIGRILSIFFLTAGLIGLRICSSST